MFALYFRAATETFENVLNCCGFTFLQYW